MAGRGTPSGTPASRLPSGGSEDAPGFRDIPIYDRSSTNVPAPSTDIFFDGAPADLTRLIAHVRIRIMTNDHAFDTESKKCGFLASHFRGQALDWIASEMGSNTTWANDLDTLIQSVALTFGTSGIQAASIARTRLESLKQGKTDLLLFLAEYDSLSTAAGLASDASRLAFIGPKLDPYYREAVNKSTVSYSRWSTYRSSLISLYSMRPATGSVAPDNARRKAKCGKCGKKGHTASECRSTN